MILPLWAPRMEFRFSTRTVLTTEPSIQPLKWLNACYVSYCLKGCHFESTALLRSVNLFLLSLDNADPLEPDESKIPTALSPAGSD